MARTDCLHAYLLCIVLLRNRSACGYLGERHLGLGAYRHRSSRWRFYITGLDVPNSYFQFLGLLLTLIAILKVVSYFTQALISRPIPTKSLNPGFPVRVVMNSWILDKLAK